MLLYDYYVYANILKEKKNSIAIKTEDNLFYSSRMF